MSSWVLWSKIEIYIFNFFQSTTVSRNIRVPQLKNISIQYYITFSRKFLFNYSYLSEFFYSLVMLNAFIYASLLVFFFTLFFLFDFRVFRTLSEYKFFKTSSFFNTTLVIIFLSLAGVPPFLGFLTKFLLFATLFFSNHFFFYTIFLVLNMFIIFFYVQNIRFLVAKNSQNIYIYFGYKVYLNFSLVSLIVFFNFLNVSALIFFDYILIWVYQLSFFINIY